MSKNCLPYPFVYLTFMIIIKGNTNQQNDSTSQSTITVSKKNLKVIITIERVSDGEKHVEKVSLTEGGYQALKRHFSNL